MKTLEVATRALNNVEGALILALSGYLDAHTVADFDRKSRRYAIVAELRIKNLMLKR